MDSATLQQRALQTAGRPTLFAQQWPALPLAPKPAANRESAAEWRVIEQQLVHKDMSGE